MTDFERNIRTLIVCFVVAIMFLIPLVMLEANRRVENVVRVLGDADGSGQIDETDEVVSNGLTVKEVNDIVLPNVK